ncbi:unnamed protein product [Caenorhabditis nigoni]|uniref:N-alpha-acetyltransferase 60 n=1 Tax=Caenorhabditis nigoni TaxID=1611254 RepID=A0A2G5VGI4_9PELO|nr:hypothetical protein B9Z55_001586 [Caenorhabditis nigoni]
MNTSRSTTSHLGWSFDPKSRRSRGLWIDEDGMTPSSSSEVLKPAESLADSFTLRKLKPYDRLAVETLCNESFPIQYPDCWYDEVVSGGLTSTGLFDGENLAAMIVSETKFLTDCNLEDQDIISESNVHVTYILSIAVNKKFRRLGLATRLLNNLMASLIDHPPYTRVVFLHVLSTNSAALSFYKMHGFEFHASLPDYYRIGDQYADGCTYVKYTNGSHAQISFSDVCKTFGSTICMPLKAICKMLSF